jgi:hypothetical protein
MSPRPAVGRRYLPTSPFQKPVVETVVYEVGDLVSSDRHGLGKVVSVEGGTDGVPSTIVVDYRGGNLRRTTLPSTSITKLDGDKLDDEADTAV